MKLFLISIFLLTLSLPSFAGNDPAEADPRAAKSDAVPSGISEGEDEGGPDLTAKDILPYIWNRQGKTIFEMFGVKVNEHIDVIQEAKNRFVKVYKKGTEDGDLIRSAWVLLKDDYIIEKFYVAFISGLDPKNLKAGDGERDIHLLLDFKHKRVTGNPAAAFWTLGEKLDALALFMEEDETYKTRFTPAEIDRLRREAAKHSGEDHYLFPELHTAFLQAIGEDLQRNSGQVHARVLLDFKTKRVLANEMAAIWSLSDKLEQLARFIESEPAYRNVYSPQVIERMRASARMHRQRASAWAGPIQFWTVAKPFVYLGCAAAIFLAGYETGALMNGPSPDQTIQRKYDPLPAATDVRPTSRPESLQNDADAAAKERGQDFDNLFPK